MKAKIIHFDYGFLISPLLFLALLMGSCAGSNVKYKQEYARVWKETIKSDAWKASLNNSDTAGMAEDQNFYAGTGEVVLDASTTIPGTYFDSKYKSLVANAYFKIIAEAEKADKRLKEEYQRLTVNNTLGRTQRTDKGDLARAAKKYEAHNAMLSGLKSWNIMSEYGSDDLEFFQAEHRQKVVAMMAANQSEEAILNYLVYKLADLYHFE